jgi:hypothetical protein
MSVRISLLCGHGDEAVGCRMCVIEEYRARITNLETRLEAAERYLVWCGLPTDDGKGLELHRAWRKAAGK